MTYFVERDLNLFLPLPLMGHVNRNSQLNRPIRCLFHVGGTNDLIKYKRWLTKIQLHSAFSLFDLRVKIDSH